MNEYRKQRCIEIAQSMQYLRTGKSLHFSFILDKNKLLCYAANDYKNQHLVHKFGPYLPYRNADSQSYIAGRHSESQVLRVYLAKFGDLDVSGLTLFNVRLSAKGEPVMAMPCVNCDRLIKPLPFKEIVWTE